MQDLHATLSYPNFAAGGSCVHQSWLERASVCSLGFGLLFPAYGSFMAIESSGTEDDTQVTSLLLAAQPKACNVQLCPSFVCACSG